MSSGAKSRNVGKFRWNFDDSDHLAFRAVLIVVAWHKKARTGRTDVQKQELVIIVCVEISVVEGVAIAVDATLDHHVAHSLGCAIPGVAISGPTVGDGHIAQVRTGLAPGVASLGVASLDDSLISKSANSVHIP